MGGGGETLPPQEEQRWRPESIQPPAPWFSDSVKMHNLVSLPCLFSVLCIVLLWQKSSSQWQIIGLLFMGGINAWLISPSPVSTLKEQIWVPNLRQISIPSLGGYRQEAGSCSKNMVAVIPTLYVRPQISQRERPGRTLQRYYKRGNSYMRQCWEGKCEW